DEQGHGHKPHQGADAVWQLRDVISRFDAALADTRARLCPANSDGIKSVAASSPVRNGAKHNASNSDQYTGGDDEKRIG
ncbi:MAG: hypothetical protein PUA61_09275, partial [Succinatimonas hippei]|nr:hypothetical protein [Succinatimonas hippei]